MFERIEVWERVPGYVWIYVIFRDFRTGLFHVQQASAICDGNASDIRKHLADKALTEIELFLEEAPCDRATGYATAEEAVTHHKAAFADMMTSLQ